MYSTRELKKNVANWSKNCVSYTCMSGRERAPLHMPALCAFACHLYSILIMARGPTGLLVIKR